MATTSRASHDAQKLSGAVPPDASTLQQQPGHTSTHKPPPKQAASTPLSTGAGPASKPPLALLPTLKLAARPGAPSPAAAAALLGGLGGLNINPPPAASTKGGRKRKASDLSPPEGGTHSESRGGAGKAQCVTNRREPLGTLLGNGARGPSRGTPLERGPDTTTPAVSVEGLRALVQQRLQEATDNISSLNKQCTQALAGAEDKLQANVARHHKVKAWAWAAWAGVGAGAGGVCG